MLKSNQFHQWIHWWCEWSVIMATEVHLCCTMTESTVNWNTCRCSEQNPSTKGNILPQRQTVVGGEVCWPLKYMLLLWNTSGPLDCSSDDNSISAGGTLTVFNVLTCTCVTRTRASGPPLPPQPCRFKLPAALFIVTRTLFLRLCRRLTFIFPHMF